MVKTNFNFDVTIPIAAADGPTVTLCELGPGEGARVVDVDLSTPAGRRLLDLGFLPDTPVRVLRRAPLGDPVVYELRGYRVCLRRADAARIRVRSVKDAP